jgi:hypothetical protein
MIPLTNDTIIRFWKKVSIADNIDCWLWTAFKVPFGYGQQTIQKRPYYAHRI